MDIAEIVKNLSYKPDWSFQYWHKPREAFVIRAHVQHSVTLEWVTFEIRRIIPRAAKVNECTFLVWVEDMLVEAEIHEMREFFRYKGQLFDSPHETTEARSE